MYCKQCGQQMGEWQKFCIGCGAAAPVVNQPSIQVKSAHVPMQLRDDKKPLPPLVIMSTLAIVSVVFLLFIGSIFPSTTKKAETQSDVTASDSENSPAPAEAKTTESEVEQNRHWVYEESEDKIRGTIFKTASVESINTVEFKFPYGGVQRASFIAVKNQGEVSFRMAIPKGQFVGDSVYIRFDDAKAKDYVASSPSDGSSDWITIIDFGDWDAKTSETIYANKLLKGLRTSKKMLVEAEFYQEGDRVFEFDVSGFKF